MFGVEVPSSSRILLRDLDFLACLSYWPKRWNRTTSARKTCGMSGKSRRSLRAATTFQNIQSSPSAGVLVHCWRCCFDQHLWECQRCNRFFAIGRSIRLRCEHSTHLWFDEKREMHDHWLSRPPGPPGNQRSIIRGPQANRSFVCREVFPANFRGLVLGCIEAKFCK